MRCDDAWLLHTSYWVYCTLKICIVSVNIILPRRVMMMAMRTCKLVQVDANSSES